MYRNRRQWLPPPRPGALELFEVDPDFGDGQINQANLRLPAVLRVGCRFCGFDFMTYLLPLLAQPKQPGGLLGVRGESHRTHIRPRSETETHGIYRFGG